MNLSMSESSMLASSHSMIELFYSKKKKKSARIDTSSLRQHQAAQFALLEFGTFEFRNAASTSVEKTSTTKKTVK